VSSAVYFFYSNGVHDQIYIAVHFNNFAPEFEYQKSPSLALNKKRQSNIYQTRLESYSNRKDVFFR